MKAQLFSGLVLVGLSFALFKYKNSPDRNEENETMNTSDKHHGFKFPASNIDWSKIKFFSENEFQGESMYLDAAVVYALVKLREKIGRIRISPAAGAISRERVGSQHDRTGGRLSTAIDIMPIDVDLKAAYEAAKSIPEFGGIGLYPDWKPSAGLHLDIRHRKYNNELFSWSQINGEYVGLKEAFA